MTKETGSYYSVWQHNEFKDTCFGTPTGVAEWAAKQWGRGCSLEPLTEEEHKQVWANIREREEAGLD